MRWARKSVWLVALGVAAISIATPVVSPRIAAKWFELPYLVLLAPIPLATAALLVFIHRVLDSMPCPGDIRCWVPFAAGVGVFVLAFLGLAYSFYPYVVPGSLTVWEAASAPESLMIMFLGALAVLPVILAYTVLVYRVFGGKATDLRYD